MMNTIKQIVEEEILQLCENFKQFPYTYFTENDVICALYSRLKEKLVAFNCQDKEGNIHSLLHTEYATPFRCDMRGDSFEIKAEGERTQKGGTYKRGHYDLVVLNPEFIAHAESEVIQGQNYQKIRDYLLNNPQYPMILYGIEVMYSRSEIKSSRGTDKKKGAKGYLKKIRQDLSKLEETIKIPYCMTSCKMLVLFRENRDDKINKFIKQELSQHKNILSRFV